MSSLILDILQVSILLQALPEFTALPANSTWWQYCLIVLVLAIGHALKEGIKRHFEKQAEKEKELAKTDEEKLDEAIRLIEKGEKLKQLLLRKNEDSE
ncbi:hypothetical protein QNI19_16420 [Cytophagaceae bacterium DM2B3-1]|uniref:Uncharacterized protein n=1 Tax=Xanthocytophaga flava TaxID=3048013 RepID=A0ABT7CLB1_9BACT|nr:hypothetical protein [Xanthocytophaga flavus]MDJ1494531.1 hypothetical protein [Xanthocytophaga flavus]